MFIFTDRADTFAHAVLNALDMFERDMDVRVVLDGRATRVLKKAGKASDPVGFLLSEALGASLVDCVCQSCADRYRTLDAAVQMNLPLTEPAQGHPSIADYLAQGYEILTF